MNPLNGVIVDMPNADIRYPCPVCGEEHPDTIYVDRIGTAIGCNECLDAMEPEHYHERRGSGV